jgi:hypothetical protein
MALMSPSDSASAPMSARIESYATAIRQPRDHLIPNARVKSGGMTEEDWRFVAGPLRQSNFDVID